MACWRTTASASRELSPRGDANSIGPSIPQFVVQETPECLGRNAPAPEFDFCGRILELCDSIDPDP